MQPVCYHFAGNTRVDLLGLLQSFVNEMKLPFTKNNQSRTRKWAGGILADDGSQSSPPPHLLSSGVTALPKYKVYWPLVSPQDI